MRPHRTLTGLVLLALGLGGCATRNPVAPAVRPPTAGPGTFVIASGSDRRLPAPGEEASGASTPDRDLFDRIAAARPGLRQNTETNPVVFWNRLTTELGLAAKQPPPLFSRSYALVQVGIYDALVASGDHRRGNLPRHAVAAGAATQVLGYLFPGRVDRIAAAAAEQIALDGGLSRSALGGWALGRAVGNLVVTRGKRDGSDIPFSGSMPTGDGIWTGTNPVLPMCGTWKPWILSSGSEFKPEPPYAFGSQADLNDVQEVYDVSLHRTAEQIDMVHKWADLPPPTIWNGLLNDRLVAGSVDLLTSARAHAYLNAAMADAFIACWDTKYLYWIARPFQRTPGLVTVIPTPNFPSYTSGHSTISAAAAEVMGEVFPSEHEYFEAQAAEAALSRLYGGIHFRHDNDQGLAVGRRIGERVVERMRAAGRLKLTIR